LSDLRSQKKLFADTFKSLKDTDAIFFFPFYHLGGAEIVHTEIVAAVKDRKPLVLFTSSSGSSTLLPVFRENARVLEVEQLLIWPGTRKMVMKAISDYCLHHKTTLFSCNNRFFYDFIQHKPANSKAIDLIHAFMHDHEDSPEKWSLKVVDKLDARVVINQKTKTDLAELYAKNNISIDFLSRVIYISNFVTAEDSPRKNFEELLRIIYVGRGTAEKRVALLARIAHEIKKLQLPFEFHFVGDVKNAIPEEFLNACILHGEVKDKKRLNELYKGSHILAMASTREGFPIAIMEAMMHGVVPVTSNVGGISEHVYPDKTGVLIDEQDPFDFMNVFINEVKRLSDDRNLLHQMSENAYDHALKHFNKNKFVSAYQKLFSNGQEAVN
jgi:glycosyltransferase involved in cell wall biosynthesis